MKKRQVSTIDRMMKDPKVKAKFEKTYSEFLLSEILLDELLYVVFFCFCEFSVGGDAFAAIETDTP